MKVQAQLTLFLQLIFYLGICPSLSCFSQYMSSYFPSYVPCPLICSLQGFSPRIPVTVRIVSYSVSLLKWREGRHKLLQLDPSLCFRMRSASLQKEKERLRNELFLITNTFQQQCGIGTWLQVHVLWLHRECFKQC